MASFGENIKFIKKGLEKNDEDHKEMLDKFDDFILSCDKKYSPRWVADVVLWVGRIVGTAVILGFIGFIAYLYKNFK